MNQNFFASKVEVEENIYLYFEIYGTSEMKHRIIFIQGMNAGIGGWLPQIEYFKDKAQVCVFYNRGIGKSSPYNGLHSTQLFAQDSKKLIDYLKWDNFHLVGISMGGMIIQELAHLLPKEMIKSMTLCATYCSPYSNIPIWDTISNFWKGKTMEEKIMHNMFSKTFMQDNYEEAEQIFQAKVEKDGRPSLWTMMNQLTAALTHNMPVDRLSQLQEIPIWVCTGTEDTIVRPHNSIQLIETLKPKKYTIYPNVGHALNLEIAEQFNQELHEFIEEQ